MGTRRIFRLGTHESILRDGDDVTTFDYKTAHVEVDTHTHTVLSGHAWSTLMENARWAADTGMKGLCCTEHAHRLTGTAPFFLPGVFHMVPEEIYGLRLFMGLEYNIVDYEGHVDAYSEKYFDTIQFGIASLHSDVIAAGTVTQHTDAYLQVLDNPLIDVLGHPGTKGYPCDIPAVVAGVRAHNKMIEINNNSFLARPGGAENCLRFARECKAQGVRICVASDAHFAQSVGVTDRCFALLAEVDFPPELILNLTMERFLQYWETERQPRIAAALAKRNREEVE